MGGIWQEDTSQRPDPYLEWEFRTRPLKAKRDEQWCSVHIQVRPRDGSDYLASLESLLAAARLGRLPDDKSDAPITFRMADDEQAQLIELIKEITSGMKPPYDDVLLQFFVYRLEPLVYRKGYYAANDLFETIYAGPPIVGLTFNSDLSHFDPTDLAHPLMTDRQVAIGIIDDGIAFAHERFCIRRDGKAAGSRVKAVWLQDTERAAPDNGVAFGRRLNVREIDQLLQTCSSESDIYRSVGLTNFGTREYNPLASRASHGTHVLDLAAGQEPRSAGGNRPILAVQLPAIATRDTSGVTMGSYVMQAVRAIMLWADMIDNRMPLVLNFSFGLTAGPKDGTSYLERALNDLIDYRNRRGAPTRLVMPAGNSYGAHLTAKMTLKGGEARALDWIVLPDDESPNYLEIWVDGEVPQTSCPLAISLTPPNEGAGRVLHLESGTMCSFEVDGRPVAGVYYQVERRDRTTRGRVFVVTNPTASRATDPAPAGRWRLALKNITDRKLNASLYIQRDDTPFGYARRGRQSRFDHGKAYERDPRTGNYNRLAEDCPIVYEDTLSALATSSPGEKGYVIVVGAAEATDGRPPAEYSSRGPTRLRPGPDCSAFAEDGDAHRGILAAGTLSGSIVAMSGTSVAAPQVARKIADDLAAQLPGVVTMSVGDLAPTTVRAAAQTTLPVPPEEAARLGDYIVPLRQDTGIPQRRYPAV